MPPALPSIARAKPTIVIHTQSVNSKYIFAAKAAE
jgi:hypothetical protein